MINDLIRKLLIINLIVSITFSLSKSIADTEGLDKNDLVCIAAFVPETDIYIQILKDKSNNISNIHWINSPTPIDIYKENLILGGCTEIILIFHSITLKDNLKIFSYTRPVKKIDNFNNDEVLEYIPLTPVLDYPFKKLYQQLESKKNDSKFRKLRRIRFIACDAEVASKNYPSIDKLNKELEVKMNFSNISQLLSIYFESNVSVPNIESISESFQFKTMTDKYFYTYINLITTGLGSYGESETLRGKYSIQVISISVGVGSINTKVYIPYDAVENLNINEETSIIVPRIGINLALLILKANTNISPTPFLLLTDELDSIGATIDFFTIIKIIRNY